MKDSTLFLVVALIVFFVISSFWQNHDIAVLQNRTDSYEVCIHEVAKGVYPSELFAQCVDDFRGVNK